MTKRDFEIVEEWLREAMEYGEERHNEPYEKVIKELEEIQMYKQGELCLIPTDAYRKQCDELDRLKEIGTIEEFKALKEKSEPKKIVRFEDGDKCPICNHWVGFRYDYCKECGQKIDWSE